MCNQNGRFSVHAAVEKIFAFGIYVGVMGFIVTGVISMCVPGSIVA